MTLMSTWEDKCIITCIWIYQNYQCLQDQQLHTGNKQRTVDDISFEGLAFQFTDLTYASQSECFRECHL